jgi:hypothetical protein
MHRLPLLPRRWLAALVLGLSFSAPALAIPITYQITGLGSGTLGGFEFANAAFSFTGHGDTADLFSVEPDVWIGPLQAVHIVLGGANFTPDNAIFFFVNEPQGTAGFVDSLYGNVLEVGAPVLHGWAGVTDLGPLAVDSSAFAPLDTSNGPLLFASMEQMTLAATAEAVRIGEPAGLFFLGLVLLALARTLRFAGRGGRVRT